MKALLRKIIDYFKAVVADELKIIDAFCQPLA